jgi:hypothetical protein
VPDAVSEPVDHRLGDQADAAVGAAEAAGVELGILADDEALGDDDAAVDDDAGEAGLPADRSTSGRMTASSSVEYELMRAPVQIRTCASAPRRR